MRLSASRIRSINHRLARVQGLVRPGRDNTNASVRDATEPLRAATRQPTTLKIVVVRNAVGA
jgi:hypothetical protein